jgi:hypothetical protein
MEETKGNQHVYFLGSFQDNEIIPIQKNKAQDRHADNKLKSSRQFNISTAR